MKINIIRGQNQIGGSIIEITTATTRIVLDAGINLGESKAHPYVPSLPGLLDSKGGMATVAINQHERSYNAVFVSHYHSDHTGLLRFVLPSIPIYMGETAYKIAKSVADYKGKELGFAASHFLEDFIPVTVGDIRVTPLPCDHSAYGAFMFLVQEAGADTCLYSDGKCLDSSGTCLASSGATQCAHAKSVLYTADYRSTGRMNFDELLNVLPEVDVLLTEGTTLSRGPEFHEPSEQGLEDFAVETLMPQGGSPRKGPAFVYLSAQNVDRITTAYNVSKRTGRRFIMDELTSEVAKAADLNIEGTVVGAAFGTRVVAPDANVEAFSSPDFLLCVTPQTLPNIERLNRRIPFDDGTLFFARREVYMLKPVTAALIALLKAKGVLVPLLHTSGHADSLTIERLVRTVNPSVIIPIHTENAAWFSRFEDECDVIYECKNFKF